MYRKARYILLLIFVKRPGEGSILCTYTARQSVLSHLRTYSNPKLTAADDG